MTDTTTTPQATYPLLWYTSNTPLTVGQRECAMARYLGYHAGKHGTGYRLKAKSVPLVTGGAVHTGLELLGQWILDWQDAHPEQILVDVPVPAVAWAATEAATRYRAQAEARGLSLGISEAEGAAAIALLIAEQATLIEALVWVYALTRLQTMTTRYRLLQVEAEEAPVLGCTCGLGDWVGQADHHETRGCTGIVMQGRADFLWESREDGAIVYEEFKTKSTANWQWEQAWEHAPQLFINMQAGTERLGGGRAINAAYVPVLYKGARKRPWGAPVEVPKTQDSALVYGYFDPGNLPMRPPEWKSEHESVDDLGVKRRLPKTFQRVPIWDPQYPLEAIRPGASRVETWVRGHVTPLQLAKLSQVLGPFPRPITRVQLAVEGVLAEETQWRDRVTYLRALGAYEPGRPEIDTVIPRSWNCTTYGGRCQFYGICSREPGWEDLSQHPLFQPRTPHHETERGAFERVGVVFPAGDFEAEDGDAEEA